MCRPATCGKCGKATYVGCGAHVEQVLGGVRPEDRCHCRDEGQDGGRSEGPGSKSTLERLKARFGSIF
jgi:hypothetical protein